MTIPAQTSPYTGLTTDASVTVGTASTAVLAAGVRTNFLEIQNTGTSAVGLAFGTRAPTNGGLGSYTLSALAFWRSNANFVPQDSISGIVASGTSNLKVTVG